MSSNSRQNFLKTSVNKDEGSSSSSSNFKVVVRVRPPLRRETRDGEFKNVVAVDRTSKSLTICEDPEDPEAFGGHTFT